MRRERFESVSVLSKGKYFLIKTDGKSQSKFNVLPKRLRSPVTFALFAALKFKSTAALIIRVGDAVDQLQIVIKSKKSAYNFEK